MSEFEKLKPCPFCGSSNVVVADLAGYESFCKQCHASGPILEGYVDYETVKNLWNNRAKQSMQGEAVAYARPDDADMKSYPNLAINYPVRTKAEGEYTLPLYTHAPDDAAVIADLQAQVEELKVKAARWEKCKTMSKQWWLNAMEEAGLKGGISLDEQIDAAISKGGAE